MSEYKLADGSVLTDEEIEKECASYERGEWEGTLERIHTGRKTKSSETLVSVVVKFPASMVAAIDERSNNRSDYIRKAVASTLI